MVCIIGRALKGLAYMNLKSDNQNVMQLPKHLNLTVSAHDKFSMCIPVWYTYINLILYCRSRGGSMIFLPLCLDHDELI